MAPALGPAIAGWAVDHAGWQSVFVLGAPPALLAILVAWVGLSKSQISDSRQQLQSFDWFGVAFLAALVAVVFAWPFVFERSVWLSGVCALAWLAACRAFWLSQQQRSNSIIPTALFAFPAFRRAALITFVYGVGMYGSIFLIPLLLQDGLGFLLQ